MAPRTDSEKGRDSSRPLLRPPHHDNRLTRSPKTNVAIVTTPRRERWCTSHRRCAEHLDLLAMDGILYWDTNRTFDVWEGPPISAIYRLSDGDWNLQMPSGGEKKVPRSVCVRTERPLSSCCRWLLVLRPSDLRAPRHPPALPSERRMRMLPSTSAHCSFAAAVTAAVATCGRFVDPLKLMLALQGDPRSAVALTRIQSGPRRRRVQSG